ncbi:ammonium transporter [Favolaschia claudopus]|uniref:Ammonium transporter n=1 Tax=Favolaschia claudopus TaxID=2862362 RepID=A0AAW0EGS9_9AGAR
MSAPPVTHPMLQADASQFDRGDLSFIIVAGILVLFMVPGLGFLYSGLARRKSARELDITFHRYPAVLMNDFILVSLVWAVTGSNGITIFQWFFWGYSLAFSSSASNGYIGNLRNFGLRKVLGDPSPGSPLIPELLYSFFQMEFACVTASILIGGIAERGRLWPAMVFTFCWVTLGERWLASLHKNLTRASVLPKYISFLLRKSDLEHLSSVACWAWNNSGWAFKWGVLDFAGGGPVELGSGVGGLALAWVLGHRGKNELLNFRPHNVSIVNLGTFILWFGWLGFNGGSAFGANLRAIMAIWNSMLASAFAGMTWVLLDFRLERRWSMVGLCSGTIAGLVAATPSSGFIPPWASVIVGILSGGLCNFATKVKFIVGIDDALDLFAEHAVGGAVGLFCNGLFASSEIIALDGVNTGVRGGWLDRNWKQLYMQIAYIVAVSVYTFVVTAVIAKAIDLAGLRLRITPEEERLGMDEVEVGEFASDYIELRRDYMDGIRPFDSSENQRSPAVAGDRHGVPDIDERSRGSEGRTTDEKVESEEAANGNQHVHPATNDT